MTRIYLSILALLAVCAPVSAQQGDGKEANSDIIKSENWKKWGTDPIPVLSPEESLKTFKVAPGFKVELVASEPLIKDPVFAEWDSEGRLWVCEFRTYMIDADGTGENQRISRVMVLEDTDDDGRMDKATPFLEDMLNPRTLSIVDGGVIVVESGTMWFCEDKDGDLKCEKKTKLMDFATSAHDNIEHAENAMHYAIDNWMYNSKSDRKVKWENGKAITKSTLARGQWGMSTDAYGRLFFNSNSSWFSVDWAIYDKAWPVGSKKTMNASTKEVFPIHPTPALNRAYKPDMLNENGNPRGVTSISGLAVHSSGAYGEDWEGAIFSFSPGTNTVGAFKPDKPFPETTGYDHVSFSDEKVGKREFLASTDTRFRPVNGSFGPDGCLYVVDFHRGIIQHKRFLTSYLRKQSEVKELDQHIGFGRIYRVVPEDTEIAAPPKNEVAALDHPYLWWRLDGQQKIVEANNTDLADDIKKLATDDSASPFGRAHALWTLAGLNQLDADTVKTAVRDSDWFVSMTALRLAGHAYGNPDLFPADLKTTASEVANQGRPLIAAYAEGLTKIGYPSRVISTYKDKEPKWVSSDKKLQKQYRKGRDIYKTSCGACHQLNGKGLVNMAPQLAKSDWIENEERLIAVALHGVTGPIKVNGKTVTDVPPIMPGHAFLDDEKMADVLTYIRNAWGNQQDAISKEDVANVRAKHGTRFMPWTEAELEAMK